MAAPTNYPDFCTGGSPNVDATGLPVSNGYADSGAGAIPTAKNINWLFMYIGQWIRYLSTSIGALAASLIGNDKLGIVFKIRLG